MKTFKVLSCAVLLLTAYHVEVNAAIPTPDQPANLQEYYGTNLVKAIYDHGRLIPVVDLPEVEISALHTGNTLLKSMLLNGKNRLVADLPEIEISATALKNSNTRSLALNSINRAMINLPLIEVISDLPMNKLLMVSGSNHVPMIDLPEIVINANPIDIIFTNAILSNGTLLPLVNLPEIEITSSYNQFSINTDNVPTFILRDAAWYTISLERCGIVKDQLIVCEIRSVVPMQQPSWTIEKGDLN